MVGQNRKYKITALVIVCFRPVKKETSFSSGRFYKKEEGSRYYWLFMDFLLIVSKMAAMSPSVISLPSLCVRQRERFLRVSFSRVCEFITGFFHFPAWDLLLPPAQTPDRRDQYLLSFTVSSERHRARQSGVNEIAQVLKRQQVILNLGPFDRKSDALPQVVLNPGPFDQKPCALPHDHRAPQMLADTVVDLSLKTSCTSFIDAIWNMPVMHITMKSAIRFSN